MIDNKYSSLWLLLVQFEAQVGYRFNDLIDFEGKREEGEYHEAWANVIVKAKTINESIEITSKGFREKNFKIVHIDKSENLSSLIENSEINKSVVDEANWLLTTDFVFMISDRIFPYNKNEQN